MPNSPLMRRIHEFPVSPGSYALWWFGQQGWVVKTSRALAAVDLFLSPHPQRRFPALVAPEDVIGFDLILGSHDHKDHIDREAWPKMAAASPKATFVLPRRSLADVAHATGMAMERFAPLDDGQAVSAGDLKATAVPSAHEWIDYDREAGGHRWLGYVLEADGAEGAVYHAGDTCVWEGMRARLSEWRIRAALLPINGRDAARFEAGKLGCMLYQEAGDLADGIGAEFAIPGHYDSFARDAVDPGEFARYVASRYPDVRVLVPERGERLDLY